MRRIFVGLFLLILGLLGMTAVYSVRPDRIWTMLNQEGVFGGVFIESPLYEGYLILFGVCSFFGMLLTFAGFRNRRRSAQERSQMRGSVSVTESNQSSLIVVVRWIVVVPTAIISDMLFDRVFEPIARWIIGHIWFVNDPEPFVPLFSGAAGALAFVLSGAAVAPNSRGIVALVLAVLEVIGASLFLGLIVTGVIPHQSPLAAGVNVLGHVLGAAAAFYIVFRAFGWRGHGNMSLLWRA